MGDVVNLNRSGLPDGLAPGVAGEMRRNGTVGTVCVSVAHQEDARPDLIHVMVSSATTGEATGVAAMHNNAEGHQLADYVGRAVVRALSAVSLDPISDLSSLPKA